jgi:hypothetical protein
LKHTSKQLADQRDQTLRVLGEQVREAGLKAGIEETALNTMVGMIYSSGSERLKGEYTIAQETLKIEKSIAEGKLNSAQEQIDALLLIQKAAAGNAEAAAAEAKKELDAFKIEMPALPAIDTSQFAASVPAAASAAGAAGAAASKPIGRQVHLGARHDQHRHCIRRKSALVQTARLGLAGWLASGTRKGQNGSVALSLPVMEEERERKVGEGCQDRRENLKSDGSHAGRVRQVCPVLQIFSRPHLFTDAEMAPPG